jgi:hypothetical protein
LKDISKEKRHGKVTKGVLFLHDNAPAHRALATQKKLAYRHTLMICLFFIVKGASVPYDRPVEPAGSNKKTKVEGTAVTVHVMTAYG